MRPSRRPCQLAGRWLAAVLVAGIAVGASAAERPASEATASGSGGDVRLMPIGDAWAANSINAAVYRNDPVTTHGDRQYAAYYNADGRVVIAARKLGGTKWTTRVTELQGKLTDAHNVISIIADGAGYLHLSWDHHDNPLRYAVSKSPDSPEFVTAPMTGRNEAKVTYPQFFAMPGGDLLFLYRDGSSGRGNLVVNRFEAKSRAWSQVQSNLISGEDRRNAYPQACVDAKGTIHVSWVWRESPDVASNHDLCYARSTDGGVTWTKSDGTAYALPITAATAEVVSAIPQKHELINQTSMCADGEGRPIIATYFRPEGRDVVQYFVVHKVGPQWQTVQVSQRKAPFSLSGGGTKAIPISRPQVVARTRDGRTMVALLFRDAERGSKVSVARCDDLARPTWSVSDLTDFSVRFWEPSYDHVRWQRDGVLDVYVQAAGQGDAEGVEQVPPQAAHVLEWTP